ncbi:hypothetical protein RJ55_02800 [Drechmeria coniospora]|nr:hypothetical protein RJ55_02800 [Drechmeria coniospora]
MRHLARESALVGPGCLYLNEAGTIVAFVADADGEGRHGAGADPAEVPPFSVSAPMCFQGRIYYDGQLRNDGTIRPHRHPRLDLLTCHMTPHALALA